jgi:hypothetical protein
MIPSYRPSARQELLLQAALLPDQAARAAWQQVRASHAVDALDRASQSLLPLVYRNLVRLGVPDEEIDWLKQCYLLTWSENQRVYHAILPLLRAFEQAGIDAVALKGLALIARYYRDPGLRPMADVDLLLHPSDVARATELAARLDWHPRQRPTAAFRRVKHAGPFDHPTGVACDIHWRVFAEAGGGSDDDLRAAAETVTFQETRLRILSPTDQLLHVCAHAARWGEVPAIRWVADAVLILRDGPIEWQRFLAQTARRRFTLRMRLMLAYLRQALDVAIPPAVFAELARQPVSMLERVEHRVRNREHRLLGELPTYVFNCWRGEPRPLLAFPGYLRDAWGLDSSAAVPGHALRLAARRAKAALAARHR